VTFRARIVQSANGANGVMGLMVRASTASNAQMFGILSPRSKAQTDKISVFSRPATGFPLQYPNSTNFLYSNAETSPGYLRLSRLGNFVSAEFSDDGVTWKIVGTSSGFPTGAILTWGLFVGQSTTTATFDSVGIVGTSCGISMCTPDPIVGNPPQCIAAPENTFVECSQNQWRLTVLATSVVQTRFTINPTNLVFNSIIDGPFNNYTGSDQFLLVHKAVTGDGVLTAQFSGLSQNALVGLAFLGKGSAGTTIDMSDSVTCFVPRIGNLIQKTRANGTLSSIAQGNPLSVDFTNPATPSIWLQLVNSASLYQCSYSFDGQTWVNTSVPFSSPANIGSKYVAGLISNLQSTASNIDYSGFTGFCNNKGSCGTSSTGMIDQCKCTASVGSMCQTDVYEFHIKDGSIPVQLWSLASIWVIKLSNGTLIDPPRMPTFGDVVYMDAPGQYTVQADSNVVASTIYVGGTGAQVSFDLASLTLLLNGSLNILSGSSVATQISVIATNITISGKLMMSGGFISGNTLVTQGGAITTQWNICNIMGTLTCYGRFDSSYSTRINANAVFQNSIINLFSWDLTFVGASKFSNTNVTAPGGGNRLHLMGTTTLEAIPCLVLR
jgi:hypothetical protein